MEANLVTHPLEAKNYLGLSYPQFSEWKGYFIKWIENAPSYLSNKWVACLVLMGVNITCFEIALVIYRTSYVILNRKKYGMLPENKRHHYAFLLESVFFATIGLANWTFCKVLKLPLGNWKIVAISLPTNIFYIFLKTRH